MKNQNTMNLIAISVMSALLTGCLGDAETTIVELEPIVETPDESDHDSDEHNDNDILIESMGRLAVMSLDSNTMSVLDIDDGDVLDTFDLSYEGMSLSASSNKRYAVLTARDFDLVEFADSGLWREDHADHLHDFKQAPSMSDFELNGSRPTHVTSHDGQLAAFYDGDEEAGTPAAVQLISENEIGSQGYTPVSLSYSVNMHGVAKPRGEVVLSTIRRDDVESTSNTKVLPDQVGVYHLHDDELELEQTLSVTCPDLHGAAQNHEFVAFGCGDGVLVAYEHDDEFEAEKIDNITELDGLRVGSLYSHEESELFVGVASNRATGETTLVTIDPEENEMEVLDWQGMESASPISYSFTYDGAHFVILDNQGYLTLLAVEQEDGHTHLHYEGRVDITEMDVASMPEGTSFSMTVSHNDNHVYISDPMAQHILQVDIETLTVEGDIELDFTPTSMVWLGIAEEGHDH